MRGLSEADRVKILKVTHNLNVARVEFMRRPQNGEYVVATMPDGTRARIKVCAWGSSRSVVLHKKEKRRRSSRPRT